MPSLYGPSLLWAEFVISRYPVVKLNSERKPSKDSFFNPKEFIRVSCIVAKCWKIAFHLQVDQTQ